MDKVSLPPDFAVGSTGDGRFHRSFRSPPVWPCHMGRHHPSRQKVCSIGHACADGPAPLRQSKLRIVVNAPDGLMLKIVPQPATKTHCLHEPLAKSNAVK